MCRVSFLSLFAAVGLGACGAATPPERQAQTEMPVELVEVGQFVEIKQMASAHVAPRDVTIWLPPGYAGSDTRYPVLYMHDGQNLFQPGISYTGDEWQVDETMTRLIGEGRIQSAIVVGISHSERRWQDYAPQAVIERLPQDLQTVMYEDQGAPLYGDAYLTFLVDELKPYMDATYRTRPEREHTLIAGSSMGGLISLYAMGQYPEVFSAMAGLSIHWPLADPTHPNAMQAIDAMTEWLAESRLHEEPQRIWFDRGSLNLDSYYAPYSEAMEVVFEENDWPAEFRVYEGTDHNEAAWAARLEEPLIFLLGDQ